MEDPGVSFPAEFTKLGMQVLSGREELAQEEGWGWGVNFRGRDKKKWGAGQSWSWLWSHFSRTELDMCARLSGRLLGRTRRALSTYLPEAPRG